jgi:putative ABC transport system ATP-binding protein
MMHLELQNLLPLYFEESKKQTSEIWGKDLRFEKGEMIKIIAPSGSGKSSLTHFVYGTRQEYSGTISYDGENIRQLSVENFASWRKDHMSIVFQDLRLLPEQTVLENIDIKRQLNPYHPVEKIEQMAKRLGIGKKLSSKAKTCSYGEQQRVAIIRALMQPFDFLMLDEPFSHLDNINRQTAMELMMEEAHSRGAAIIFADLERVDFFPYTKLFYL